MSGDRGVAKFADLAKLELDEVIDELVERAQGVKRAQGRLRTLFQATELVTGDLSQDQMLHRIVDAARTLARAQYAALGVIGADGGLDQFIHVGMDDDVVARIGRLPEGKGLLGALIADPQPIRLQHISDDERSAGFPEHHPPMDSFLGVPIRVRGEVFGDLYLADSQQGAFTAEDEALVVALAGVAGSALSNARLYHESQVRHQWLEASAEFHAQLLNSTGEDPVHTIARQAIELADADLVTVALLESDLQGFVIEAAFGLRADELLARRFDLTGSLAAEVLASAKPVMARDSADLGSNSVAQQVLETGPILALPLRGTGDPHGVLTLARSRGRRPFTEIELSMADAFAQHTSVALELAQARTAEQKIVLLEERERIARDLHDHVIQQLFAIGLTLDATAAQMATDDPLAGRIHQQVEGLDSAIRRIRSSIFALRGDLTGQRQGLRQAVLDIATSVAPLLGFSPTISFTGLLDLGLSETLTEDATACVRELLTNVGKHAEATSSVVEVALVDSTLAITVTDNGVGIGPIERASGVANLRARAERRQGTFDLRPAAGGGTVASWKVKST